MGTAVAAILGCFSEILFLARFMGLLTQLIIRCSHCLSENFLRCFDHSLFHNAQGTMSSREQKDGGCYQKSAPKKGDGIFAEAFKVNEKLRLPTAQISVCLRMDMNLGIVCVCIYLE